MSILWLEPPNMGKGFRSMAQAYLRKAEINPMHVQFASYTDGCLMKVGKKKWVHDPSRAKQFHDGITKLNPDFIVCNDKAALGYLTGKYNSLALCRGGVYKYAIGPRLVPVLVIDDLRKTKSQAIGHWVLSQDIRKLHRWLTGDLRNEAAFNYKVCNSLTDIYELLQLAQNALAIAVDIETTAVWISSIQYTVLSPNGKVATYVVPIINPTRDGGCHWSSEDIELQVWQIIRQINDTPCFKILQNGSYDSVYFLVYKAPLRNYICDTMHGWHSLWTESPKRLDFMASIAMDTYCYWKDEGKEDAKEDKKGGRIPKTAEGLENYWRYGALDTHNTLHIWLYLIALLRLPHLSWALDNYVKEMRQQFGPGLAMTMRGVKCNSKLQLYYAVELQSQSDKALTKLRIALDDPEYNPNSPQQTITALYDIYGLKPYGKKGRTTDEKVLKMIKGQNIFADWFVDTLWECKKPANNVSKYGKGVTLNGRFLYKMGAANTETGRYGSRGHDLWVGNNIQNMPYIMRAMLESDDGYVLFDIDYAQSDAYFTAFDLQEEKMIEVMLSDDDTHCIHAAFFFKKSYDELYAAHKQKADWVSHNVWGIRSITKRIVYGANYKMMGPTLLLTMTREPVVAAAKQLGYHDAHLWTDKQLAKLCDAFLAKYFQMYPTLMPALRQKLAESAARGNLYTCAFGRTRLFFGNLSDDKVQREFAAYIGQGGTAGNINLAMEKIYYGYTKADNTFKQLEREGVMLLFQVHDSLVGQVPNSRLDLIAEVESAMQNECTLHGRTFTVPTEADCGLGWGKRLMKYKPNITLQEIQENDAKWWEKWRNGKCL